MGTPIRCTFAGSLLPKLVTEVQLENWKHYSLVHVLTRSRPSDSRGLALGRPSRMDNLHISLHTHISQLGKHDTTTHQDSTLFWAWIDLDYEIALSARGRHEVRVRPAYLER